MELIKIFTDVLPTKENVEILANQIILPIVDGEINEIDFLVKSEFILQVVKNVQDKVKKSSNLINKMTLFGATIEPVEAGTKYNYKSNQTYNEIKAKIEPLEIKLKALEEKIKMATKLNTNLMDDDGTITASPVERTSTSTIKITLGK